MRDMEGAPAVSPPSARMAGSPLKATSPTPALAVSPASQYERLESNIGEGTYGKVHKAKDTRTGRVVAIKKAKVSVLDRDVGGIGFTVLREIKLMQAVRHPNVMGCLDVFADGGSIHLVMEFMDGDLRKIVEDRSLVLSEPHVKCLSSQMLAGLSALHEKWFVHRDVTPTNVLLSFSTGVARIGDFGFARTIGHAGDRPLTGCCTTLWYRAPELLYGAKFYGQPVDLWSLGCVVAEVMLRKPLFQGRGELDMLTKIFETAGTPTEEVWRDVSALPNFVPFQATPRMPMAQVLPGMSAPAQALVDGLLALDPKSRPTARDAASHEFFRAWPEMCRPEQLPFVGGGAR